MGVGIHPGPFAAFPDLNRPPSPTAPPWRVRQHVGRPAPASMRSPDSPTPHGWDHDPALRPPAVAPVPAAARMPRSEEHTSELQSLMPHSYAVFCLKKKSTAQ